MWNLKYDTNELIYETETDSDIENRLVVAKGEGGEGGKDSEFGISRCKLLYIGWVNNKVLLYSTGNYIQYPVINHNGKEYEKEYICITESLCCTAEIKHNIVNQLYFNKINFLKRSAQMSISLLEHIEDAILPCQDTASSA